MNKAVMTSVSPQECERISSGEQTILLMKTRSQIEIVEDENTELEGQICSAVENYFKHEENIFQSLDITTAIGLYSAYPNLKSNELVQNISSKYERNKGSKT